METSLQFDNYVYSAEINKYQNLVDFRHHRDPKLFLEDTMESCKFSKDLGCSWIELILNGDFEQAFQNLKDQPISLKRHFERLNMDKLLFTICFMQKQKLKHIFKLFQLIRQKEQISDHHYAEF